jgi:hypothetical protein
VQSHRLLLKGGPSTAEWRLQWDDTKFVLKDPDGQSVFETDTAYAHRVVDIYELYAQGKISLTSPLRKFVEAGIGADNQYRAELRRQSLRAILRGIAIFVIAGGLFTLYCWYASWAPDPPHWVRWFGWLIHGILLLLLAIALAGPWLVYFGLRQWLRIRRIERAVAINGNAELGNSKEHESRDG